MNLTTAQLSQLRDRPHRTRLWLSIFRPQVLVSATINQPGIDKAARDITVTITSGSVLPIQGGETLYIGTSAGSKDIGRIRLRSATSTVFTVAENSIVWDPNWFLTVVRYFEPWGVFPRIELDANNVPIFYKDYDILYTDQNQIMDPVVNLGPNHAGFLTLDDAPPTGIHRVFYNSSGTYDPTIGGSIPPTGTHAWHFEGGNPTGSFEADPGYVTYTGCGYYVTSLTVTTPAGASFTGRRHISVLTRPEDPGSCKPYFRWGMRGLEGSRSEGGYSSRLWVRDVVDVDEIVDGALVVIFSEDFEGTVQGKVGANAENRNSILYAGYILDDSIIIDPVTNVVDFKTGGVAIKMGELTTFSTALDDKTTASSWTDMRDMIVDRALVHFLRWHSTVLAVADFSPTTDDKRVEFIDVSRGNVYEAANGLLGNTLMASLVSDRQGKLWAEVDANVRPTGSSRQVEDSMQTVISMTRQDWRGQIGFARRFDDDLAYVELGGIAYSGKATGTFDAYLSGAPGNAPSYFGSTERTSGLVILGQDQINTLSGLVFASDNALYPELSFSPAGDYRFLDIAPQQRINMTVTEGDNFRRVSFSERPFLIKDIKYNYRPRMQALQMEMGMMEETSGPPGDTVIIPVDPPYDRTILPDWDIDFPPIIPPDIDIPPVDPPPGTGDLIYLVTGNRLTRSRDFVSGRATGSSWEDITPQWETSGPGGGPGGVTGTFRNFYLDPLDPINTAYLHTDFDAEGVFLEPGGPHLYRINNLNGATGTQAYTEILTPLEYGTAIGVSVGDGNRIRAASFGVSPINPNVIYGLGTPGGSETRVVRTTDGGATWTQVFSGTDNFDHGPIIPSAHSLSNAWFMTHFGRRIYFTNSLGASWTLIHGAGGTMDQMHVPFQGNDADRIWYHADTGADELRVTNDNGSTFVDHAAIFDGVNWKPGFSNDIYDQNGRTLIKTWHLNRLLTAMIAVRQGGTDQRLFYAEDGILAGISSWLPRALIPNVAGNNISEAFLWHETNVDLMALVKDGDNDMLLLSVDRGLSFIQDGLDRWEEDIGTIAAPDSLGFTLAGLRWPSIG